MSEEAWTNRNSLGLCVNSSSLPQRRVTDYEQVFRQNAWIIHANAKKALASRSADFFAPEDLEHFDKRRDWNRWREIETLLDYFSNLKYSDSKLPTTCNSDGNIKLMCSSKKKGRFSGLARSNSIWLDAVEAPKILF